MRSSLVTKMVSTPLTFPYFDIEQYKNIGPLEKRYRASIGELTPELAEKYELNINRVPEIILAQFQAGKYVGRKIKEKGMTAKEASEAADYQRSSLSKVISGELPFSPSVNAVSALCYNVLNESCNKVMFGFNGRVNLPSTYSEVAKAMYSVPAGVREELYRKAEYELSGFELSHPTTAKNILRRPAAEIVSERIYELTYDKGVPAYEFFGPDTPYLIRRDLTQFVAEQYRGVRPRIGFPMFLALETGIALDYFVAENFTHLVDCYYKEGDDYVLIKDQMILKFLGICATLPPDKRYDLMGDAIGEGLKDREPV